MKRINKFDLGGEAPSPGINALLGIGKAAEAFFKAGNDWSTKNNERRNEELDKYLKRINDAKTVTGSATPAPNNYYNNQLQYLNTQQGSIQPPAPAYNQNEYYDSFPMNQTSNPMQPRRMNYLQYTNGTLL